MRKIPRTGLAPEDLAVIAYHEDNGDLVILRFSHGQERDISSSQKLLSECDCLSTTSISRRISFRIVGRYSCSAFHSA